MMCYNMTIEMVTSFFLKGLIDMKSRIITAVTEVSLIGFFVMIEYSMVAYPMYVGAPSY